MTIGLEAIEKRVRAHGTRFVRFTWCDNGGVIRCKAVTASYLDQALVNGVGIAASMQALPALFDRPVGAVWLPGPSEVQLRPAAETFVDLAYAPGHARVMADMYDGAERWTHCPRAFLRRAVGRAAERGWHLRAAFENEFYLLHPADEGLPRPVDTTVFAQSQALDRTGPVLDAIVEALEEQGATPEQVHAESGPGQFEISIHHAEALMAADRQVMFRETVRGVAMRHGLVASFLPKLFTDAAGSGAHLHLSLWRNTANRTADPANPDDLSAEARAFVGGILTHLPAIMAITTPTTNSFRRLRPQAAAGAFVCWGHGNREAAVRVPRPMRPGSPVSNFEFKTIDPTCNPYLALGAVITAGLDGLERGLDPGQGVEGDPANLAADERAARGIAPLPASLGQALEALERDEVLLAGLGPDLSRSLLGVRRAEWEALKDATQEQEVRLLLERY